MKQQNPLIMPKALKNRPLGSIPIARSILRLLQTALDNGVARRILPNAPRVDQHGSTTRKTETQKEEDARWSTGKPDARPEAESPERVPAARWHFSISSLRCWNSPGKDCRPSQIFTSLKGTPRRCIAEVARVLLRGGSVTFAESRRDSDFIPIGKLQAGAEKHGLELEERRGPGWEYTARFRKS
jgi:hypothetical protein